MPGTHVRPSHQARRASARRVDRRRGFEREREEHVRHRVQDGHLDVHAHRRGNGAAALPVPGEGVLPFGHAAGGGRIRSSGVHTEGASRSQRKASSRGGVVLLRDGGERVGVPGEQAGLREDGSELDSLLAE